MVATHRCMVTLIIYWNHHKSKYVLLRRQTIHILYITWINIDLSSKVLCGIQLRAIWQEMPMNLTHNMCL